jgi:hypothetical protein
LSKIFDREIRINKMKRTIYPLYPARGTVLTLSLIGLLQVIAAISNFGSHNEVMILIALSGTAGVIAGFALERYIVFVNNHLDENNVKVVSRISSSLYLLFAALAYLLSDGISSTEGFIITGTLLLGATVVSTLCVVVSAIILAIFWKIFILSE